MQRRDFNSLIGLSSLGLMSFATPISHNKKSIKKHNFNLNYAPHLGMFKHHVGNDPIDQLNFMADIGFKAFEDNVIKVSNFSPFSLKDASSAHDTLESRKGGGSIYLIP